MHTKSFTDPVRLLQHRGLHITAPRKKILSAFLHNSTPLTQQEIKVFCHFEFDRVTLYRTLDLFVSYKLIHILPAANAVLRYALLDDGSENGWPKNHLHFICEECGKTTCMKEAQVPELIAPKGFYTREVEVVMKGVCDSCFTGLSKRKGTSKA